MAASIVTTQLPVPLHAPAHPAKTESAAGAAVRVTVAPVVKFAEQVAPQLIPVGLLETVPVPVPVLATERLNVCKLNIAVTDLAASIVTEQVPVPEQAPLHPAKRELADGVAVNVTEAPALKEAEQAAPQLIPAGEEVTVPVPVPVLAIERVKFFRVKVAVTDLAVSIVTLQLPVPLHAPDQPVKSESADVAAVRVTAVPALKLEAQAAPQSIPAGEEVTVPVPVPALFTVSAKV